MSRQREWAKRKRAEGFCGICGHNWSGPRFRCEGCRRKFNAYERAKRALTRAKEAR